jgi:hypothetical protein
LGVLEAPLSKFYGALGVDEKKEFEKIRVV